MLCRSLGQKWPPGWPIQGAAIILDPSRAFNRRRCGSPGADLGEETIVVTPGPKQCSRGHTLGSKERSGGSWCQYPSSCACLGSGGRRHKF